MAMHSKEIQNWKTARPEGQRMVLLSASFYLDSSYVRMLFRCRLHRASHLLPCLTACECLHSDTFFPGGVRSPQQIHLINLCTYHRPSIII